MKTELVKWAEDQSQLDTAGGYILEKLAKFADAECCAWAPVKELARLARKSERAVQYKLRELEGEGLIEKTGRMHRLRGSTRSVPIYQLAPQVEGLGAPISMGAKSAPIGSHGCKNGDVWVQAAAPAKEQKELISEEANAPSESAGVRDGADAQVSGFEAALQAWPQAGLARTDFPAAEAEWLVAAAEVGAEKLLACVWAARSDSALSRGDYGAPGLHRWLREKRFRAFLGVSRAQGVLPLGEARRTAFAVPADLVTDFKDRYGEPAAASWLSRCGWRGETRTVVAAGAIAAKWLRDNASVWLKAHGLTVERSGMSGEAA